MEWQQIILDKVCRLEFEVVEASESDDYVEVEDGLFTVADAVQEGMLSRKLAEIGMDWVRAALGRANERGDSVPVREVLDLLENPICKSVHPHMLIDDEFLAGKFSDELLIHMENMLGEEIQEDERFFRKKYAHVSYSHEKISLRERLIRKKEILLDIQLKCRKEKQRQMEHLPFAVQWKQINELFELVRGEHVIKNQWEVELIQKICGNLLRKDNYGEEDWKLREKALSDLVSNRFYEKIGCGEMMWELSERLCVRKEEFLVFADLLNQADRSEYERKAASLYHQYGREDKYISYLEAHLGKEGKIYAELVDCYHKQGNIDGARKVARQGLEQCRDELTDLFIWLLADARRSGDTENYKKLYASAKRRRGADIKKIDKALESAW